jgi:hypothetical protein
MYGMIENEKPSRAFPQQPSPDLRGDGLLRVWLFKGSKYKS